MKQRRKKVLSLLLAAACSLSLGSQGAAAFQQQADTITDGSELSQMVRDHWLRIISTRWSSTPNGRR